MNEYAAVLTIPGKAGKEIGILRKRYADLMDYVIVPHITLAPVFTSPSELSLIRQRLDQAARKTNPFALRLNGVRYFEGANNVAYVSLEDTQPIFALNRAIAHALQGLVTASQLEGLTVAAQPLLFNLRTFVPHATIAEHIPDEKLATVKSDLSIVALDCSVRIRSFSLFFVKEGEKPQIWRRAGLYRFGGATR